jgi:hypothetical protein
MTMLVACPTIKLGPKRRSGHAPRAPGAPTATRWAPRLGTLAGLGRRQLLTRLGNLEAGPRRWGTTPRICCPGADNGQPSIEHVQVVSCLEQQILPQITQSSSLTLSLESTFHFLGRIPPQLSPTPILNQKPTERFNSLPGIHSGIKHCQQGLHKPFPYLSRNRNAKSTVHLPSPTPPTRIATSPVPTCARPKTSTRPRRQPHPLTNLASHSRRPTWMPHLFLAYL